MSQPNPRDNLAAAMREVKAALRAAGHTSWTERHVLDGGRAEHQVDANGTNLIVPVVVVRHPRGCGCPEVVGARETPGPPPRMPWRTP